MNNLATLLAATYKTERATSRRLVARTGMPEAQALRQTLESSAGADGLAALLARRGAERHADEQRRAARGLARAEAQLRRQTRHDGPPTAWRAWFDGSAQPNPGRCGIGAVLSGPAGIRIDIAQPAGYGNSSEAEYRALIAVLEAAVQAGSHQLTIYGDSQVVVNDVNGADGVTAPSLLAYRTAACSLLAQLRDVTLRWIPRHKNAEADALSQRGCRQHQDARPEPDASNHPTPA
jgi:ribonuclease HI